MSSAEDTANERPPARADAASGVAGAAGANAETRAQDPVGEAPEATERARIGYIGKRLGRFQITAELGRGGMATVYRARDPQIGRDVAVKVMHGFFAGRADIEARFRREANAVAAIRHPSILALYDFAPPAGEEPGYIVSELIEGPGLRRLLDTRSGRLLPEVAAIIGIRVAEALGAAHAAGIVHRDVKPDNVLIDTAAGRVRVVLTDFGVAHVSGMDTMTATGAVLGSPAYMSPEQARGEDVGPASDVFSLGVLLYQLCTGHLPFSGKDPLAVISAILRGEYLRPGKVEARVGPQLERVITRCLHRDPTTRFADGGAVAVALREAMAAPALGDEEGCLRRYLEDPATFEREASPAVAQAALAAATEARRLRQLPRALAEVGRALAYAPDDPAARDLLARLGSGPRPSAVVWGVVGVAAVALAGGAYLLIPGLRGRTSADAPVTNKAAAVSSPSPVAPAPSAPRAPPTIARQGDGPAAAPLPAATAPGAGIGSPPLTRQRRAARAGSLSATATRTAAGATAAGASPASTTGTPPAPAAGATAGKEPAAPDRSPAETVPAPAAGPGANTTETARSAATASIVVRASHGFCEPSVDAHPPSLRASHDDLSPGRHDIFCTLPQGGGKIHVGTYNLRPGTRPSLIVVRGPAGQPVLGPTE